MTMLSYQLLTGARDVPLFYPTNFSLKNGELPIIWVNGALLLSHGHIGSALHERMNGGKIGHSAMPIC